jgi:hypothetical protein
MVGFAVIGAKSDILTVTKKHREIANPKFSELHYIEPRSGDHDPKLPDGDVKVAVICHVDQAARSAFVVEIESRAELDLSEPYPIDTGLNGPVTMRD